VATAVSHSVGIARIRVTIPGEDDGPAHMDALTRVFRAMADAGVSLDMFTPSTTTLLFTVREQDVPRACSVLDGCGLAYELRQGLAKVTLIGAGMHGVPGVMARVAESLATAGVNLLQTADSHTTISVLVPADEAVTAVTALHDAFDLAG
jgi:aspartate kinase